VPLVLATGAGSARRRAIGTGVLGGMLSATILAVLFVPVFYLLVRKLFPAKPSKSELENTHDIEASKPSQEIL
jgi:multidrug efflux pump